MSERSQAEIEDWAAVREGSRIGAILGVIAWVMIAGEFMLFQGRELPVLLAALGLLVLLLASVLGSSVFWALLFVTASVAGRLVRRR